MSRTKPVDRLLRARQYVRDAAAERLELARRRLQQVLDQRDLLTRQCRDRVESACEDGEAVTAGQLQTMADACKAAGKATCVCAEEMEVAREEALASYQQLRQVEILRERARSAEKVERRKKERKELDEIASRPNAKLVLPILLIVVQGLWVLGCQKEESAAAPDAAVTRTDAGPASKTAKKAKKPKEDLDEDELLLLRKLKKRHGELQKMKGEIDLREARLKLLQAKADKTLGEVKKIQGQIIKRVTGVAPAPAAPRKKVAKPRPPKAKPVKNLVDLNKVLSGMNTRAAAGMLAEVDPDIAARAIRHMPPRKASGVLAQMEPDRAALLAERLSRKEKTVNKGDREKGKKETRKKAPTAADEGKTFAAPKKKKKKKRKKRRRRRKKKASGKKPAAKMVKVEPETKKKKPATEKKPAAEKEPEAKKKAEVKKPAAKKKPVTKKKKPAAKKKPVTKKKKPAAKKKPVTKKKKPVTKKKKPAAKEKPEGSGSSK